MKLATIDLGNAERLTCGIFNVDGGYLAMTFTQSKSFKTLNGAKKWLGARGVMGNRKDWR